MPIRIDVNYATSSDCNEAGLERPCPECGCPVFLRAGLAGPADSPAKLDRLAHALCGCYVLNMPAGPLARLLLSVLDADDDLAQPDADS